MYYCQIAPRDIEMRNRFNAAAWLLIASICLGLAVAPSRAADGDQYLGNWSGTWAGANNSSGRFQLTLERGGDGKLTGSIAVTQDGGGGSDYASKLKKRRLRRRQIHRSL